jgi:hypothetical protein
MRIKENSKGFVDDVDYKHVVAKCPMDSCDDELSTSNEFFCVKSKLKINIVFY